MDKFLERVMNCLGKEVVRWKDKRCVSICSAGLDSTIAACVMKYIGFDVTLIHFDYGQRARKAEKWSIRRIARKLDVELEIISIPFLAKLGGSPLTDSNIELPQGRASVQSSQCWVPARNAVFLAHTLAYCDRYRIPFITMGINRTESNYPDHTQDFINSFNEFAKWGALTPPKLIAPCFHLIKKEEILLMKEIDYFDVLRYTWSCDLSPRDWLGRFRMCGKCGCCHSSKKAFLEIGIEDPRNHASYSIEDLDPYNTE